MKRKVVSFLVLVPLLILLFPGCSFGEYFNSDLEGNLDEVYDPGFSGTPPPMEKKARPMMVMRGGAASALAPESMEGMPGGGVDGVLSIDRKIIYKGDVRIEVKSCVDSIGKIKTIVDGVKGVIADTSVTEHDEGRKSATVVIRVPADKF